MSSIPGETHRVRRLLPDHAETTVAEQLDGLDLREQASEDRPYVVLNFVASVDGRATVDGRSGALGSRTDLEMLQRLRTRVDAVMIGAGTMRAERYGRIVSDPDLGAYRESTGLAQDPVAVLVSNSLDLPWDAGLFTDGGGEIVIFTSDGTEGAPETVTPVTVVEHEGAVDLDRALEWLVRERGVRSLLCEGGPVLHGELQARGLADELFLTLAPKLVGREERSILAAALPDPLPLELVWLLDAGSELFTRYRVSASA